MQYQITQRRQRGLTLIELLLVLVVVLAIAVTGFILFGQTSESQRSQQAQQALLSVGAGVGKVVSGRNFAGISNAVLIQAAVVPENLISGVAPTQTLVNPWGGAITVSPSGIASGTNNTYQVQFAAVPRSGCTSLLAATAVNFYRVQAGATVLINRDADDIEATAVDIAAACNAELNTITWTATG